jgi:hypothetical protein
MLWHRPTPEMNMVATKPGRSYFNLLSPSTSLSPKRLHTVSSYYRNGFNHLTIQCVAEIQNTDMESQFRLEKYRLKRVRVMF